MEDDPQLWDLVALVETETKQFSLEYQSKQLFLKEHLQATFSDTPSLLRFTTFLSAARAEVLEGVVAARWVRDMRCVRIVPIGFGGHGAGVTLLVSPPRTVPLLFRLWNNRLPSARSLNPNVRFSRNLPSS